MRKVYKFIAIMLLIMPILTMSACGKKEAIDDGTQMQSITITHPTTTKILLSEVDNVFIDIADIECNEISSFRNDVDGSKNIVLENVTLPVLADYLQTLITNGYSATIGNFKIMVINTENPNSAPQQKTINFANISDGIEQLNIFIDEEYITEPASASTPVVLHTLVTIKEFELNLDIVGSGRNEKTARINYLASNDDEYTTMQAGKLAITYIANGSYTRPISTKLTKLIDSMRNADKYYIKISSNTEYFGISLENYVEVAKEGEKVAVRITDYRKQNKVILYKNYSKIVLEDKEAILFEIINSLDENSSAYSKCNIDTNTAHSFLLDTLINYAQNPLQCFLNGLPTDNTQLINSYVGSGRMLYINDKIYDYETYFDSVFDVNSNYYFNGDTLIYTDNDQEMAVSFEVPDYMFNVFTTDLTQLDIDEICLD